MTTVAGCRFSIEHVSMRAHMAMAAHALITFCVLSPLLIWWKTWIFQNLSHLGSFLVDVLSFNPSSLYLRCPSLPSLPVMKFNSLLLALIINSVASFAVKIPFRKARGSALRPRSTASVSRAAANSSRVLASGRSANDFDIKYEFALTTLVCWIMIGFTVLYMTWYILLTWETWIWFIGLKLKFVLDNAGRQPVSCSDWHWLKWLVGQGVYFSITQFQTDGPDIQPHCAPIIQQLPLNVWLMIVAVRDRLGVWYGIVRCCRVRRVRHCSTFKS